MILASSTSTTDQQNPRTLQTIDRLADYTFYSIEIESGKVKYETKKKSIRRMHGLRTDFFFFYIFDLFLEY
jgi:hypothetical protein